MRKADVGKTLRSELGKVRKRLKKLEKEHEAALVKLSKFNATLAVDRVAAKFLKLKEPSVPEVEFASVFAEVERAQSKVAEARVAVRNIENQLLFLK